jgi:hypothetical protein
MYDDEWESVMTAESVEERIKEFSKLAQKRAEGGDSSLSEVVHRLTHELYLTRHTTSDILQELDELERAYSTEFQDGEANDHIMEYFQKDHDFRFWHDYPSLCLAAGLEWAVLNCLESETINQ